jgi:hypothetical protein
MPDRWRAATDSDDLYVYAIALRGRKKIVETERADLDAHPREEHYE